MKKKPRNELICKQCNNTFFVIDSRKDTTKFCSNSCKHEFTKGKPTWNSGKTYEECYGEERAAHIKTLNARPGELNGMYGKTHTDETKALISAHNRGQAANNKGKKSPGILANRNQWGENNPSVKKVLKAEGITYNEYLGRYDEIVAYRKLVRSITEQQPLKTLLNFDKRGNCSTSGSYHLDHIYPVSRGFENKIPPELIGNILNLQFIPWEDNVRKFNNLFDDYDYWVLHGK